MRFPRIGIVTQLIHLTLSLSWVGLLGLTAAGEDIEIKSTDVTLPRPGSRHTAAAWSAARTAGGISRVRRDVAMGQDLQILLDLHNQFRRMEGAADMEHLRWNWQLAEMADLWAKNCVWEHGQPDNYRQRPYEAIGQNLYATTGTLTMEAGMKAWYTDEKPYYNFNTLACSKPPCGHYTQVVWATTREVGCAFTFCSNLRNVGSFNRGNYLVCNYGPAGNYIGQKPYIKGRSCSKCTSGTFWCDGGLCRSDCTSKTNCQCEARCDNGGCRTERCGCQCQPGWTGGLCQEVCDDVHRNCGPFNGWPQSWCNHPQYGDSVRRGCNLMCGLCTRPNEGQPVSCDTFSGPTLPATAPPTLPPGGDTGAGSDRWVSIVVPIVLVALLVALAVAAYCYFKKRGLPSALSGLSVPKWLKSPGRTMRGSSSSETSRPPVSTFVHENRLPAPPVMNASNSRQPRYETSPPPPPLRPGVQRPMPPIPQRPTPTPPKPLPKTPASFSPPRTPLKPKSNTPPKPPFKPSSPKPPVRPKPEVSMATPQPEVATVGGLVQQYVNKFQNQGYSY